MSPPKGNEILTDAVELIDEKISEIDKRLEKYQHLVDARVKLVASKRALQGTGSRLTGNSGTRVTIDDIVATLKKEPGQSPSQIAQEFGVQVTTINSHLHRNKDRFINNEGRYWARDPKNGLDTVEDIKEDDD